MCPQPKPECGEPRLSRPLVLARLATLEGRRVSVALDDGSRIDDCQLVSGGQHGAGSLWLFANGADRFVSLHRVVDIWEASSPAPG